MQQTLHARFTGLSHLAPTTPHLFSRQITLYKQKVGWSFDKSMSEFLRHGFMVHVHLSGFMCHIKNGYCAQHSVFEYNQGPRLFTNGGASFKYERGRVCFEGEGGFERSLLRLSTSNALSPFLWCPRGGSPAGVPALGSSALVPFFLFTMTE